VKPGDLVQKKFHGAVRIYPFPPPWGSKSTGIPDPIDSMIDGECGIVVESLEPQGGGNGVRILTTTGKTGWINSYFLSPVQNSEGG